MKPSALRIPVLIALLAGLAVPSVGSAQSLNLYVTSVEVTQAIQGPRAIYNDTRRSTVRSVIDYPGTGSTAVPLIEGKQTAVRISAAAEGATTNTVGPVYASMAARRSGVFLGRRTSGGLNVETTRVGTTDQLRERARDGAHLTWNFILPDDWERGDVQFEVQINVSGATFRLPECPGCDDYANTANVRVVFQRSGGVTLLPWRVVYNPTGVTVSDPTRILPSIKSLWPVADERLLMSDFWGTLRSNTNNAQSILAALDANSSLAGIPVVEYTGQTSFVGVLPSTVSWVNNGGETIGGRGEIRGEDFVAIRDGVAPAHELGHNIGMVGILGGHDDGLMEDGIKGFDTYAVRAIPDRATIFMNTVNGDHWISRARYVEILDYLRTHAEHRPANGLASASQASPDPEPPPGPRLLVAGVVSSTGGELTTVYQSVAKGRDSLPTTGPYSIVVLDGSGNALVTREFSPQIAHSDGTDHFRVILPIVEGAVRIELRRGDTVLASRSASANAPTVHWTDPPEPRPLETAGTRNVSWTAVDGDNDTLTYVLQYSQDGGTTWRTIDSDIPDLAYPLDMANLEGTDKGRFRVLASDGFHTAVDESDRVFPVPNKAPHVAIEVPVAPAPGRTALVATAGNPINLQGAAFDSEDGSSAGDNLTWTSSRDGVIASGGGIQWATASVGTHTVTLTARDASGASSTAQVLIVVRPGPAGRGAPRVRSIRARSGRVEIRFSKFVTGVGPRSVTVGDGRGSAIDARVTRHFTGRVVTMRSPRIRRGQRYRVRISGSVTDAAGRRVRATTRTVRAR